MAFGSIFFEDVDSGILKIKENYFIRLVLIFYTVGSEDDQQSIAENRTRRG